MLEVSKGVARLTLALLMVAPATVLAQRAAPAAVTGASAFAVEALGGTAGSAIGIVVGLAIVDPDDCPTGDDVVCPLRRLSLVGVVGIAGATLGTAVAGRLAGTDRSVVGAFLGAAVGTAVGIGLEHLVTEEMGQSIGNAGAVVLFAVTQGILAAAGSRLGARLRRN